MLQNQFKYFIRLLWQITQIFTPGIGMAAGWVYPVGRLLEMGKIQVQECNAIVKAVVGHLKQTCLPGAVSSFYNPFGELTSSIFLHSQ